SPRCLRRRAPRSAAREGLAMSAGESTWSVQTGGGQVRATSQQIARSVVHLGVSPLGTPNAVYPISNDQAAILALLDYCPLAEVARFTGRDGLSKYAVVINS